MSRRHIALVVNPRAGRGRVGKELPRLLRRLEETAIAFRVLETKRPGHATDLAWAAATDGAEIVVAVGGDGTVNEVVNGLISDDRAVGHSSLGVVPAGSGSDFARTFGLPPHVAAESFLLGERRRPIDVAKITCVGQSENDLVTRYFVNVAEAGLGAAVVERAERMSRWYGRSRYFLSLWPTLAGFQPRQVTVATDDEPVTAKAHNVVVANARYFGGNMLISPRSEPGDGLLEVQISIGPKRQAFTLIPRIYRGSHLPNPRILEAQGAKISITAAEPLPIEADGEMVGTTPVTIEALPGVLELVF